MKTLILSTLAATALFISSCSSNNATGTSDSKPADSGQLHHAAITYTCPMHPEVISDKPGKCPECKMDLVEKGKEDTDDHSGHQH